MTCLGYARVSTEDQSLDIQREQLTAAGCKRIFEEKASGKSAIVRDELQALLRFAIEGDTIIVTKLDRLARSTIDMLTIITGLAKRGVTFKSLAEPWANTDSPAAELMLTVMAGIAQFERGRIRERQRDGIAAAKLAGKYRGRSKKPVTADAINALKAEGKSMREIGVELGAGRATLYRVLEAATEPA
jgi:DNA invertase Pin-like site-specific DNA recombinase